MLNPELGAIFGAAPFLAEIKTTANLLHPHLLPLFDSGQVPAGHPDTERRAYAHERGVVHRDRKPENILLHAGQLVIGLRHRARRIECRQRSHHTDRPVPRGPGLHVAGAGNGRSRGRRRTDVYSLGAVLYEMLVGDPHTS